MIFFVHCNDFVHLLTCSHLLTFSLPILMTLSNVYPLPVYVGSNALPWRGGQTVQLSDYYEYI
jgi:hypothetical protein